jgi:hypothetical protein
MDLEKLYKKTIIIKAMLFELTGKPIAGKITFSNIDMQFTIPGPFDPIVRVAARKVGLTFSNEGILFHAKTLADLDRIITHIEEFQVEIARHIEAPVSEEKANT